MQKQWFCIDVQPAGYRRMFLGRCYATLAEIRKACGPHATITGGHVLIWRRP